MNIFAELQQLTEINEIGDSRDKLNEIVTYMKSRPTYLEQLKYFSELRELDIKTLIEADSFMVEDDMPIAQLPEHLRHDSLGFVKGSYMVYSGRYVFPVKDVYNNVAGFVGYDKFEKPKYLDSVNHGYKAKRTMLLGMEKMEEYYNSGEPLFVTEGPMCTYYFRQEGFQSLSSLGSYLSEYSKIVLRRFGRRLIMFPDADTTGDVYKRMIQRDLPEARVFRVTDGKDPDGCRKLHSNFKEELIKKINSPFYRSELIW